MSTNDSAGHAVGKTGPTGPTSTTTTQGPTGPTGAGGGSGAPGSPGYIAPPSSHPAAHAKPWQETPQGSGLTHGYDVLRTAFAVTMPNQRQQFETLAHRPIGG
ncbi:MAG TPA: hypothetical protein VGG07_25160 [Solirubrobacteraceae bacterium]|jgi:hypothetical protein